MPSLSRARKFRIWIALTVLALTYPYDLLTPNGVYPMEFAPGAYFDGLGIASTPGRLGDLPGGPLSELTAEIWLHERASSRNFGPRVIFSAYDANYFVPFQFGTWGMRLYAYSPRDERASPWYKQWLVDEKFVRGVDHTVALSWGPEARALYVDDRPAKRDEVHEPRQLRLDGRLVLGNTPSGRQGYWGEIQGFALYRRALSATQIEKHFEIARRGGVAHLADQRDIVALFDLSLTEYPTSRNASRNLVAGLGDLQFPARFVAAVESMFRLPDLETIVRHRMLFDLVQNVALFIPFGWLGLARRWNGLGATRRRAVLVTIGLGAALSGGLEVVQLAIPTRSASIVDVVLNVFGVALGGFAYFATRRGRSSRNNVNATTESTFEARNTQNAAR